MTGGKHTTKRGALGLMLGFFAVTYGAVLLRVDYFPLTWVPMYGQRGMAPVLDVTVGIPEARERGLVATRADGRIEYLRAKALGVPPANFRRLYSERMFGEGPPQHARERLELAAVNRWWYDRLIGPQGLHPGLYQNQLLDSVNRMLNRRSGTAGEIVALRATVGRISLSRAQRDRGEFSVLDHDTLTATATRTGTRIETSR